MSSGALEDAFEFDGEPGAFEFEEFPMESVTRDVDDDEVSAGVAPDEAED